MGSVDDDHLPSSLFGSLPARPPTPPREANSHEGDSLLKQLIAPQQLSDPLRNLQTPPGITSPTSSSTRSTTRRKRVGFSSQAQYQEPPTYTARVFSRQTSTPGSLPSSTSRPVKSILKPCPTPNRLGPPDGVYLGDDKSDQVNIADMLESSLQQLAGADRECKVDAYTMLFRALKTSSNLPDRIALQNKMTLFMQFIQRDLTSRTPNGSIDSLLVTSALKLLHTFLHFHGVASSISHDFGVFMVDHSTRSFEDEQAPKEVIKHLMQALFLQNFPAEVMTVDRVGRLVSALHNIENHLTGKSIVQIRIIVYEKLVKQCPQQMTVHSDWLQDLFTDMLSSISEIRSAAIKLGLSAAFALNKDRRLVSRVLELLNLSLDDKKYVEEFTSRLRVMLQNPQQSASVPKIWSVVTLFIPKPYQWDYFSSWSKIIQLSFNNSNLQVKREANIAWSRFTYRLHLDGRLNYNLVRDPLLSLLKRKGLRESVLGSVCNLYYYAFKPDMNLRVLDETWDSAVVPLMHGLIKQGQDEPPAISQAAAILTGLIDCKTRRVWKENRIMDQTLIKDDELPAIESKWIRANSVRVFALVAPILDNGFAEISQSDSQYQKLWKALVHSVASASTKDVKLHDDTAKFVASVFTFFHKIWTKGPAARTSGGSCTSSRFLDSARELLLILIDGLGLLPNPFTEKHFAQTKDDQFIVHGAQTNRSGKKLGSKRLPLHHLFRLLSKLPPGVPDDDTFTSFFSSVFGPLLDDKSERVQADLSQELLRLLPIDKPWPSGPWVLTAAKVSASLENSQDSHQTTSSGSGGNLGLVFRDIVRILEHGLRSVPSLPWQHWLQLFQAVCRRVRDESGDSGVAIAVVEPLAAVVRGKLADDTSHIINANFISATIELVAASTQPRDKQAADAARRRLWGTSNAGTRLTSFDPLDNLYKLFSDLSQKLYAGIEWYASGHVEQLLDEVRCYFDRGTPQLSSRTLVALQDGLACWLEDKERRITRINFPGVAEATRLLWKRLCSAVKEGSAEKPELGNIEPLLCAAFRSTHRDIVKITAEMWNLVFDQAERIQYPEALKTVLISLGSSVDIVRPGLDIVHDRPDARPKFPESQEDGSISIVTPAGLQLRSRSRPSTTRKSAAPNLSKATDVAQSSPLARVKPKGRTSKPRLRHEDSQMQFATISSSPVPVAHESQLLTERQKETRERQKETAAMFPELRSSPSTTMRKAKSGSSKHGLPTSLGPGRASTPEQDGAFEDYLTSTPTPRRGQTIMLPELDPVMAADPPSSPPETRGYSLLAELKTRAKNTTSTEEWEFSSSPLTRSPNLTHQTNSTSQPMVLDGVSGEMRLDDEGDIAESTFDKRGETSSQLAVYSEVIEENAFIHQAVETDLPAAVPIDKAAPPSSTTPTGRPLRRHAIQTTPRSDDDKFVDAPSSPLPATPSQRVRPVSLRLNLRRSPRNKDDSQLFSVSDSFEHGMRNIGTGRLGIGTRSSPAKQDLASYEAMLPESPEHAEEEEENAEEASRAMSCINVEGGALKQPFGVRANKFRRVSASRHSQVLQDTQESGATQASVGRPRTPITQLAKPDSHDRFENVSPGNGSWLRKRKRSTAGESSNSNKRRHQDAASRERQDEIPDTPPVAEGGMQRRMLFENEVSPMSGQSQSSSASERSASLELSITSPERLEEPQSESKEHVGDFSELTDNEEAVQSQVAREKEAYVEKAAAATLDDAPSEQLEAELAAQFEEPTENTEQTPLAEEAPGQQPGGHRQAGSSKFDRLLVVLQNGLGILRSADLTREETNTLEDMFMDMKQELYQAERRGRK